jgi:hypothetical protein
MMEEAGAVARLALGWMLHGTTVCWFLVGLLHAFYPHLFARPPGPYHPTSAELLIAATGGLLLANLAVLWRTTTR